MPAADNGLTSPAVDPGPQNDEVCSICIMSDGEVRGKLDCCSHWVCYPCILDWCQKEKRDSCPECRMRINFIQKVRKTGTGASNACTPAPRVLADAHATATHS